MATRSASSIINAFLLLEMGYAMKWPGPEPTPAGLMAINGVSPRPTQAPGSNGIPPELRKRVNVQSPPPDHWCGFVDGDYYYPLSCLTTDTCYSSGTVFGCCGAPGSPCNIYTTCTDSILVDSCDAECQANERVLKCSLSASAWCGTYSFDGGEKVYNCASTIGFYSVESLKDWYQTGLVSASTSKLDDFIPTTKESPSRTSISSTTIPSRKLFPETTSPGSTSLPTLVPSRRVLTGAAIGGIAVGGAVLILALVAAIIACCCFRRRRRDRNAAAQAALPRPEATFDAGQEIQQAPAAPGYYEVPPPPEKYSAFTPSYLKPQSPPLPYDNPPSPNQPYDPSQEFSHRASTVSTAHSPHPLHFDEVPKVPSPEPMGYYTPPPHGGISEMSEGDSGIAKDPGTGLPMQLRVGSPRIQSSVHEVPATTPEAERWELPGKP